MYGKDDLKAKRQGSIIEQHDDLDAVDMDELDRIIEKEKKAERQGKSSEKKRKVAN